MNSGFSGTVSTASARVTSSFSRPVRSGPNSTPHGSPPAAKRRISAAAPAAVTTGFAMSRGRAVAA